MRLRHMALAPPRRTRPLSPWRRSESESGVRDSPLPEQLVCIPSPADSSPCASARRLPATPAPRPARAAKIASLLIMDLSEIVGGGSGDGGSSRSSLDESFSSSVTEDGGSSNEIIAPRPPPPATGCDDAGSLVGIRSSSASISSSKRTARGKVWAPCQRLELLIFFSMRASI